MAQKPQEYMSAEELRNRLYHSLRNRGLVNSIKSQLRTNLISELQQSVQGPLTLHDLEAGDSDPLLLRAANSLVADHLRRAKYEYTLGVFLPESGLAQDKIFQPEDLMRLLHISPQSRLFKQLSKNGVAESEKGLLWRVLCEVAALHSQGAQDNGTQVDMTRSGPVLSLDAKLHSLEEMYTGKRDDLSRSSRSAVEERMLHYQRQLEDRYNSQLKMELARIKDSEVARMRLEEKEVGRKELQQTKRELQRTYQEKYDSLVERERNSIERLQREQELQEKEVYSQRQMLLSEIESIRQREAELKREAEVNKREKHLTEERNKGKEEELRRREIEMRNKELQFEQRLQNEMAQFKLDQQAKFIDRVQNVEVREAKLKEEERILSEEKSRIQVIKDELRDKTHRVNNLESALQEARHSEVTATRQNEFVNSKLRDMADYKALKEQNIAQRNELETLRTRLSELLNMNERERGRQEELLRELRRPSPETLMMQRDLERARENLRQEQVVFQQQKTLLEARLKEELDRNRDLVQRLEEQLLQMKDMNREVVDLRKHLSMTQTVLNNEVYRKPKPQGENHAEAPLNISHTSRHSGTGDFHASRHSVRCVASDLDPRGSQGPLVHTADRDVYNDADSDLDLAPISRHRNISEFSDDHSSAGSADIVAETRYRLKGLEKEAQNLERAYHDFQCHITNPGSLPPDAPPPVPPAQSDHHSQVLAGSGPRQMDSPPHSPIPHDNPMSSTPYKHRLRPFQPTDHEDSFAQLTGGRPQETRTGPPQLDFSAMSDELDSKGILVKHEKSRPITVVDLEARPGSPCMLVVAESESAGSPPHSGRTKAARHLDLGQTEPKATKLPSSLAPLNGTAKPQPFPAQDNAAGMGDMLASNPASQPAASLDNAWRKPVSSLDHAVDAEKQRQREEQQREEERRQREEEEIRRKEERERKEEEERKQREELDRRKKEEEENRKREEEEKRRREEEEEERRREEDRKKKEEEETGGIDPIMLQYMAKVQALKEQEKQSSKPVDKEEVTKEDTPTHSEELSVVEDMKSEQADDADDDFW